MKQIKRILVGLDNSKMDITLLEYCTFLINTSHAPEIIFLNIIKNLHLPSELLKEFPDIETNSIKERKEDLAKKVTKHFHPNEKIKSKILVQKGTGVKAFLKYLEKNEVDLAVVGRKNESQGTGILTQRLARRAGCNLLIVPEDSLSKLRNHDQTARILVPIDFSINSKLALEHAIRIAELSKKRVSIICQHVYTIPQGYHYSGKSKKEFAAIMVKNAKKEFKIFLQELDSKGVDITDVYTRNRNDNVVDNIHKEAKDLEVTGIVFGSKGRTAASALFLGSTAEKLIKIDTEFPLLVVRNKGENAGIIDLIKRI